MVTRNTGLRMYWIVRPQQLTMNVIRPDVEGHKLVLVDDSIVRGLISRRIVDLIRKVATKAMICASAAPDTCALLSKKER
jgi:glutamine phosphoribosylpyrophosphate amidotransferase